MREGSLADLVARTKRAHEAAASSLSAPAGPRGAPPAAGDGGSLKKRPKLPAQAEPAPRYAERSMFMSASASSVHAKAPAPRAPRPAAAEQTDEFDIASFSRKVEQLGASRLEGLSKKDQQARMRTQLGLREQKAQKMPYKRLLAVRKKQRKQDADAADLAKQAGMTVRKKPPSSAPSRVTQASGDRRFAGGAGPSLGGGLRGGVLHVSNSDIKRTRWSAKSGERKPAQGKGKGKGRGGGGKGKGGGGGRGGGGGKGGRGRR